MERIHHIYCDRTILKNKQCSPFSLFFLLKHEKWAKVRTSIFADDFLGAGLTYLVLLKFCFHSFLMLWRLHSLPHAMISTLAMI